MWERGTTQSKPAGPDDTPPMWSALAVLALALAAGGITARLEAGPRFDWLLLVTAMGLTAAVAMRLLADNAAEQAAARSAGDPLKDLVDSAGPMMAAIDLDGKLTYVNPAAERLLGYHAEELLDPSTSLDLLAPGEGDRLVAEVQRMCGTESLPAPSSTQRLAAFAEAVRCLPPSQVPSFDTHLQRKDGTLCPVRVQISAMYNRRGDPTGLVAVALDSSTRERMEPAKRETRDRYRELFENSSEMIATLDLSGRFLYVNPAWRQCFEADKTRSEERISFEDIFGESCRAEAAEMLRRALEGETIDRAPLCYDTADNQVRDLELSLHQRRRAGKTIAIQCLARDVTQQKQREHRLALQLVVSQIVGENTSAEMAAMRVLEALCISQGWDVAVKWDINSEEKQLEFSTAWGVPGKEAEAFIQQSMAMKLAPGESLPGSAWKDGRLVWLSDLAAAPQDARIHSALHHRMASGWAAPVMVGNRVLAVLEFYCHVKLREDRETTAAMETVAASLGQMLARARERERADELSRQQKILLHSVADGICGVDRNGLVRFANPAAARMLGAPATTLIGKPVHDLVHGAAPADKMCGEDCPLRRATRQRVSSTGELTIYRASGTGFPAEYFLNPILDQGRFSGSVLSFRDISQRYALDRMKDEFVSTVSHELRTPLTSIRGALGLLSAGLLGDINDKAANLLRIALTNSERLVRLINDILDLERTQSGREPLVFRRIAMADIVQQAMDGMQPVADQAGVLLIHDKTQVDVVADADRLLQVLTNLLSNAIKFSPANSAVSVMLRPGSNGVTLSVIDQGRGIPADKLEAIFERFQQVDASDARQKGGSGLGLAICRAIVMQHKGRIWAERNPVRGSTFRVFLPYQPATANEMHGDAEVGPRGKVLVVNTGGTKRTEIAEQLARYGYRVVPATTVEQTLTATQEGMEAIVLDATMDGVNGWKLLPLVYRAAPKSGTPTVLLSVALEGMGIEQETGDSSEVNDPRRVQEGPLLQEVARAISAANGTARVLIVEDDVDLARSLGKAFSREGFGVRLAHTLQAALDDLQAFQPHLMLLEIDLPEGDGFNLVDWLRQKDALARLPMVVYSAREQTPQARRQLLAGPARFLTSSPVRPEQLESLILTMLRTSREMGEVSRI